MMLTVETSLKSSAVPAVAGYGVVVLGLVYPAVFLGSYRLHVVALLTCAALLYQFVRERYPVREVVRAALPGLPVYLFFALALLSATWALYPNQTLKLATAQLLFPFMTGLVLLALSGGNFRWLQALVTSLPYVVLAVSISLLVRFGSVRIDSRAMAEAVGSQSNINASFMVLCLPFLVFYVLRSAGWSKVITAGAFASAVWVIVLAESRGALGLLIISVPLVALVFGEGWKGKFFFAAKAGMAVLLISALPVLAVGSQGIVGGVLDRLPGTSQESQANSANEAQKPSPSNQAQQKAPSEPSPSSSQAQQKAPSEPSASGRVLQLEAGATAIREHPVLGIGYNGLQSFMLNNHGKPALSSHNWLVTAWGELGIPGLILVTWLLGKAFLTAWRQRLSAFYAVTGVSLFLAFMYGLVQPPVSSFMLYIVLAILFHAAWGDRLPAWFSSSRKPRVK